MRAPFISPSSTRDVGGVPQLEVAIELLTTFGGGKDLPGPGGRLPAPGAGTEAREAQVAIQNRARGDRTAGRSAATTAPAPRERAVPATRPVAIPTSSGRRMPGRYAGTVFGPGAGAGAERRAVRKPDGDGGSGAAAHGR